MAEILKDVFEDDKGNKYYLANNTEITYDQAGIPLNNGGDLSEASVNFSVGTARKALTPKARFKSLMGDIAKWLTDLGTAAFCNVANNDTTTVSGFVADARIVKQHGDEIDGINSDLDGNRFGHTADGRPGWKDGADTVHPFNNLAAYHLTHSWDNLSQGPNNMYTITINLPACKDALLFLSARVNGISADAWTRTLNSGDLSAVEIGRKGAGLKVNVATTMICLLVTSNNGCNVTFTTNDNDYQSVKIAMLLEP